MTPPKRAVRPLATALSNHELGLIRHTLATQAEERRTAAASHFSISVNGVECAQLGSAQETNLFVPSGSVQVAVYANSGGKQVLFAISLLRYDDTGKLRQAHATRVLEDGSELSFATEPVGDSDGSAVAGRITVTHRDARRFRSAWQTRRGPVVSAGVAALAVSLTAALFVSAGRVGLGYAVEGAITAALLFRILSLKLRGVLAPLFFFLLVDFLFSSMKVAMTIEGSWFRGHFDYRVAYAIGTAMEDLILFVIVYQLLRSVMTRYPGILALAKKVLVVSVLVAFAVDIVSLRIQAVLAKPEKVGVGLAYSVILGLAVDQTVRIVMLFFLVTLLACLLWFPVSHPRNIVIFIIGFVVFMAMKCLSSFMFLVSDNGSTHALLSFAGLTIGILCRLYWLLFLNQAGKTAEVTIGFSWRPQEQERLMNKLALIDASLKSPPGRS